jgi:peptide subunit release factor RF-3
LPSDAKIAKDGLGQYVVLFSSEWYVNYFQELNPNVELSLYPESDPEQVVQRVA